MNDEHPKNDPKKDQQHEQPKQGYHEKKIEQLEKMRRLPPPAPVFKPRGSPPHKQLNDADKKYNTALDLQVKFWHDQGEKTQGMDGKAREPFNKEVALGKPRIGSIERAGLSGKPKLARVCDLCHNEE